PTVHRSRPAIPSRGPRSVLDRLQPGLRGGDHLSGVAKPRSRLGGVYLVTSPKRPVSRLLAIVEASLEGGASIVQLRDKKIFTPEERIEAARGLRTLCNRYAVPFIVIGGITPANAGLLAEHGVAGVAVISAIMDAADPRAATEAIRRAFSEGRPSEEPHARPHRKRAREESSGEHFHQQTVK